LFSLELLFSRMVKGEPLLFEGLNVPVRNKPKFGTCQAVLHSLYRGFPHDRPIRVRCGVAGDRTKFIAIDELLKRWSNGRARVNVTDLHIRKTNVTRYIDCRSLSNFNLLADAGGAVGAEEMLTMVVSSAGTFTDSHTDDPDGTNHCFVGRKLWLVWDTFLGMSLNLGDAERCQIDTGRVPFSMSGFLGVPGSSWFIVGPGQTLFLPGHLTHKVVTLDAYLGIGSFFVMLPSYFRTLKRWTEHTPLWALDAPPDQRLELVNLITRRVINKLCALGHATQPEKSRWGAAYLRSAVHQWQRGCPARSQAALLDNPVSAELVATVLRPI
jgi:hypothetical protein